MNATRWIRTVGVAVSGLLTPGALAENGALVRIWDIGQGVIAIPELADESAAPNHAFVRPDIDLTVANGGFGDLLDNFVTQVDAVLTIAAAGDYQFRVHSDDGSRLWIDQRLIIDHDGPRGADPPGDGTMQLGAGEHTLTLRHFEAGGDERLTLLWKPPGASDFGPIPTAAMTPPAAISRATAEGTKLVLAPLRRGLPGDGRPVSGVHLAFTSEPAGADARENRGLTGLPFEDLQVFTKPDLPISPSFIWMPPESWGADSVTLLAISQPREASGQLLAAGRGQTAVQRLFIEPIGDRFQGGAVRFSDGFAGGVQELKMSADRWIFVECGPAEAGGQPAATALRFNPKDNAFEIEQVDAMSNGLELHFSRPLDPRCGWDPGDYWIEQWPFDMATGKAPRRDGVRYPVKSASVSEEGTSVFLEIEGLKASHVIYVRLLPPMYSREGDRPWSTEAWYTMNLLPDGRPGEVRPRPAGKPQNVLTDAEKAEGWRLLFDGQTLDGWHRYGKPGEGPKGWSIVDGCLVRTGSGGDIATDQAFDDFELSLEWRISAGGNSGIMFNVDESKGAAYATGPEMQVLDNAEHHDGQNTSTSAGSNYALHAAARNVTKPVGFFNQARIVVKGPHVEHWLNGEKIVEYELGSDDWKQRVAASKFASMPDYGTAERGLIVLQDHGDMVWYRNVMVREK